MGRVACLPVTVSLLAGFAVADIPHPLDDPVEIVFTGGVRLSAGGKGKPRSAVAAKDIPRYEEVSANVAGNGVFLFSGVGPIGANALGGLKQLRGIICKYTTASRCRVDVNKFPIAPPVDKVSRSQ